MSVSPQNLILEPEGRGFRLTRIDESGDKADMLLSEDHVMALALSAERMRDHIAARYMTAGAPRPVPVVMVGHLELNHDIHETHLQMTMVSPDGHRSTTFALPADVARTLLDELPDWVAKLEKKKPQH